MKNGHNILKLTSEGFQALNDYQHAMPSLRIKESDITLRVSRLLIRAKFNGKKAKAA
jgi:hypothetical protein